MKVIKARFLDSKNLTSGRTLFNDLIIQPTEDWQAILSSVEAEQDEGRPLVLSLSVIEMSQKRLENLQEWEP